MMDPNVANRSGGQRSTYRPQSLGRLGVRQMSIQNTPSALNVFSLGAGLLNWAI